ncbi:hypothetical protein L210DRAFT_3383300 [Boletus edulis BED1]|uniref:F-box domain-containing protein n=1 Tax=Boletus edulis BED1 TaxID=1328754 RepID=A0AAD4GLM0_BOLED|nr:hypothetical protein L210DRAFT_3383300 [Boletus edulis BED1]
MHHALEIQEILLNIFGHCYWLVDTTGRPELASLARTCRAFKEPALDILWEEFYDLSPLTRCLPEASHQLSPNNPKRSFRRPLTQIEWDILQSYTRRIRRLLHFRPGLDEKSIRILSNPPTIKPLFPNLRQLRCHYHSKSMLLLQLPFPSLDSLWVNFKNPRRLQDPLQSFSKFSPNITDLSTFVNWSDVAFDNLVSNCLCQWQNIQIVICPETSLDMDALAHLSRLPALSVLNFKEIVALSGCISPLFFSNLCDMKLHPTSLGPVSQLLSRILLPALRDFTIAVGSRPSRQELFSFLTAVQTCNPDHTIERFSLYQFPSSSNLVRSEAPLLRFAHLQLCMASALSWNVSLTDSDLLALALAWPSLVQFDINTRWGWNTPSGITPNGLLQLLQKCPSLEQIALAMDTRGYTGSPPSNFGLTSQPRYLNVLDSIIEAESVPAIAALLTGIAPCRFAAWSSSGLVRPPGWEVYDDRWEEMHQSPCHS